MMVPSQYAGRIDRGDQTIDTANARESVYTFDPHESERYWHIRAKGGVDMLYTSGDRLSWNELKHRATNGKRVLRSILKRQKALKQQRCLQERPRSLSGRTAKGPTHGLTRAQRIGKV